MNRDGLGSSQLRTVNSRAFNDYTAFIVAHELLPIDEGKFLSPKEVVRRLRAEFDYVDADSEAGTDSCLA